MADEQPTDQSANGQTMNGQSSAGQEQPAQDKEPYEFGGEDYADYISGLVLQSDREILRAIKILAAHLTPHVQQPITKIVEEWEQLHPSLELQ